MPRHSNNFSWNIHSILPHCLTDLSLLPPTVSLKFLFPEPQFTPREYNPFTDHGTLATNEVELKRLHAAKTLRPRMSDDDVNKSDDEVS